MNHRAFTLIEVMVVTVLMVITTVMIIPTMDSPERSYLQAGLGLVISDLDYAQATAISNPDQLTLVRFDPTASHWWVAPESAPDTPYVKEYTGEPFDTYMGEGRASMAQRVTFVVTGMVNNQIEYDAFGRLNQQTIASIVLTCDTEQAMITIDPETGFLCATTP
ncbi:MAG: prepilin-type N-terminal cleavage/methylation domain-containing protein [Planctomycetes bacterium]|nr:prepilin-type N-terminal cleavage/methylation domain-containing protein [Planctomycetota bacterium]NOG56027.1 prepilin-type N-terminal cleavage/methylation domain-containing protein [Planctomycetota bacterium]